MPICSKGIVVWVRNIGKEREKMFLVGVEFMDFDPRRENALRCTYQRVSESNNSNIVINYADI